MTPSDELREAVARLVDPEAWERRETYLSQAAIYREAPPDEAEPLGYGRFAEDREATARLAVAHAFRRADQILSLPALAGLREENERLKCEYLNASYDYAGFAAEIERLREELAMARVHVPRPPILETTRSTGEDTPPAFRPASISSQGALSPSHSLGRPEAQSQDEVKP